MGHIRGSVALGVGLVLATAAAACGSSGGDPSIPNAGGDTPPGASGTPGDAPPYMGPPSDGPTCTGEATDTMDKGPTQLAKLCARGYGDPITKAFCGPTAPKITSLADLLAVLGLTIAPPPYATGLASGKNGNPSFILTSQSASITTRMVSQLNPRTIIFTPPLARGRMTGAPKPNPSYVALGFTRGDQGVELLAKDPTANGGKGDIRFFLLKYEQACNAAPGGCTSADLFSPAVESNFLSWSLYDDQDLKNTTLDCLSCHQPGGTSSPRMLRMQELQRPWTHWMYNDALDVDILRTDFHAAHGTTESYGGIPGGAMDLGDVQQLEAFVENNGFITQPNEFLGAPIASELAASGTSSTWQGLYSAAENAQDIPAPYYDVKATDPTKVQSLIAQYKSGAPGDMKDVFDIPAQRAMTHRPAAGLTGKQILVQMCGQCHNSRLDQTISRSAFNVEKLDTLSKAEKDQAVRRINLPQDACGHMPPVRFRELDASEIALAQAELQK